jgi:cell division transport system permease protein
MGLRGALSDRMLLLLVAAMAFLAALALAGWFGTAALSRHWQHKAGASLTVQVPRATESSARGDQTRLAAVLDMLIRSPVVASARALSDHELRELLSPWLGQGVEQLAIPIPAVISVRLVDAAADLDLLYRRISEAAPGTLVEDNGVWISRLAVFARSLQACAALALLLVAFVAAAVIGVATRAGLSTRREAIEIVHGLGATDRYITSRFSERAAFLSAVGSAIGTVAALPILLTLAHLAAPFSGETDIGGDPLANALGALSVALWLALPGVPASAAAISYATAYGAVRWWLRGLP